MHNKLRLYVQVCTSGAVATRLYTSVVVFVHSLQPAYIVMGVWNHMDVNGIVDRQHSRWTDVAPLSLFSEYGKEIAPKTQQRQEGSERCHFDKYRNPLVRSLID